MMAGFVQYWRDIWAGASTTIVGIVATLRHMPRKEHTLEYPEQHDVLPPRTRMSLFMNAEDCIACNQCARVCPVDCIHIESEKRPKGEDIPLTVVEQKKKSLILTRFEIDMGQCCYCALCVDPCPTHCLYMTPEFELSVVHGDTDAMLVRKDGESYADADGRRIRTQRQEAHPKFGRTGFVYDFMAINEDLHRRGEHVPLNPLFPDEYAQILNAPVPRESVVSASSHGTNTGSENAHDTV